jgi:1-acyl-sn-glycerol-3-phosphate acyltransferase
MRESRHAEAPRAQLFHFLRKEGADPGDAPTHYDPDFVERVIQKTGRLFGPGRYFGLDVRGFENVPDEPSIIVSNHSGGTTILDVWGFAIAWYRRFGTSRPLHVLGHELIFATRATARFFERVGVVRAAPKRAERVLTEFKRDVLVLPGGDHEVWRPWRKRWDVDFNGRTGYARLALETRAPIVPVAHAGAHETLMVLTSGEHFAKKVGLHRLARAEVFPIHLSLPWGLGIGPLPHLPLPAKLRYVVGAPIVPLTTGAAEDGDEDALDVMVRSTIQSQLDELKHEAELKH